jgi:putative protease
MAAIEHGADAVYIGAPRFGARAEAAASIEDLERLIRHAHLYYAKVYVALNTILTDSELSEAVDIIHEVYRLGVDGVIIQDVGLLESDLPPIPLIASTQMHNDTPEKVRFLEDVGIRRAILARELSLEEIATIRKAAARIELEVFVHGALCVSYSGQCYMSQAVAGRSGNRGVCAQPCRSRYTLTDGSRSILQHDKYLLSLKDLNRMNAIPDLVAAGVTSFKIEGRYKGIDYVKNVTAAYRQAIDAFLAGHPSYRRSSSGSSEFFFSPDTGKTFNRGYTDYFLRGKREKIGSPDTQKSTGQLIGTVASIGKGWFRMKGESLANGDGLCFFSARGELTGFRIDRIDADFPGGQRDRKIYPNSMKGLETGAHLYRNHDAAFSRALNKPSARRTIGVEMLFVQENGSTRLLVKDEDGNASEVTTDVTFVPARDPLSVRKQVEAQLSSTGNTPYIVTHLEIRPEEPGFLPVSVLNRLRREALEALTKTRQDSYCRRTTKFEPSGIPYPSESLDFCANVLNEYARQFYRRHGAEIAEPAFETLKRSDMAERTVMTTRYCVRHELDLCPRHGRSKPSPTESLRLRDAHNSYRLEFDCRRCMMRVVLEKK